MQSREQGTSKTHARFRLMSDFRPANKKPENAQIKAVPIPAELNT